MSIDGPSRDFKKIADENTNHVYVLTPNVKMITSVTPPACNALTIHRSCLCNTNY